MFVAYARVALTADETKDKCLYNTGLTSRAKSRWNDVAPRGYWAEAAGTRGPEVNNI